MATNVKIVCKYYQIREYKDNDITEKTYDLIPWLNHINKLSLPDRYKEINGVAGRLEEIVGLETSGIYALNFMRTDEVSTSYKVRKDKPAEHIDIEVGEYMAKNTVCLYDSKNEIIMIQCNRGGYAESSISSYINSFWDEQRCAIVPIREDINFTRDEAEYIRLDVRLANIKEYRPSKGSFFEGFINEMNRIEGLNAHVEISLGNNRKARLNKSEMKNTIVDLYNNAGCVSSAKIKLTDDNVTGLFDLFDNLCKDDIKITINDDDKGCVKFDKLANRMNDIYSFENAKQRVLNALKA